jgi:hypothetical protein
MVDSRHNGGPALDGSPDREGHIRVYRRVRDHWLVGFGLLGRYSPAEAWQDLLMECKYQDGYINNAGRKMILRRGQLLGATLWLATRWSWTVKQVRLFLDKLEAEGLINRLAPDLLSVQTKTATYTDEILNSRQKGRSEGRFANVISICNYDTYQAGTNAQGQVGRQVEGRLRAGRGQVEGNNLRKERREEREERERTAPPHMNGIGFVISEQHGLFISAETVTEWRERFPHLPDLEAQMAKLGSVILAKGRMHAGWTCPEGWMAGCLADDNARAKARAAPAATAAISDPIEAKVQEMLRSDFGRTLRGAVEHEEAERQIRASVTGGTNA